jgi:Tol biopolymer transport system component
VILLALLAAVMPTPAEYFGQNKVPWPARHWQVLETEHFRIHYEEQERDLAQVGARIAERGYARLSHLYDHTVREPIPVLLYGSQSEFRETRAVSSLIGEGTGGLTEFFKRRVIVPATGSRAELEHVLIHEIAHAFQVDILMHGRPGRAAEAITWTPPLWVMEGLSEYLSVPGIDTNTEMWLRDAVLTGQMPDLMTLEGIGDIRVYRFGQAAVAHIAARFGDGSLGPWLRSMARHRSVTDATSEVFGMSLERLSDDWHAALRRRYLPQVAQGTDPDAVARRLTDHRHALAGFYVTPAISPDGLEIAYVADETPYADLYRASAVDGRHRRRMLRGERRGDLESLRQARTSIDWSPDGKLLALVALSGERDHLVLYDPDASRIVRSFEFGFDEMLSPSFSPDGREIVFVGLRGGASNLYRVTVAGDSLRPLLDCGWGVLQPDWSPDGRRIAFATDAGRASFWSDSTDVSWEIGILDLATGGVERLRDAAGKNLNPQWMPDGRHLLYLSDRDGATNIYARDLLDGRDYALTDLRIGVSGLTPFSPALSVAADGKRAIFSAFGELGWDLFALEDPLSHLDARRPWVPRAPVVTPELPVPAPAETVAAATATGADTTSTAAASADTMAVAGMIEASGIVPDIDLRTVLRATAALPETLSVREASYRPQLTLDYVQAGGYYATQYGASAEAVLGFSDMLGEWQAYVGADVSGSLGEGDYLLGFLNQRRRSAWGAAAYQYVVGYGVGVASGYVTVYQKRVYRGVGLEYIHPLSHFRRVEVLVDGIWERRYEWGCTEGPVGYWTCGWGAARDNRFYVAPEVAWVYDSALFGSTGPLSGRRARLSAGFYAGERSARTLTLDLRTYMNIRKSYAIAWRGVLAGEWGHDREQYAFGGPYTLHGYADDPLIGTTIAFSNLEFRFPFVDHLVLAWPLRIHFYGIRGALFFDLGGAWDDPADFRALHSGRGEGSFHLEDLRAACGARAAVNLGFTVVRWEVSRRTDLSRWLGSTQSEIALGWEF